MRDPLRDSVRATMHDGTGTAVLDGQRAGVHHCPGEDDIGDIFRVGY